VTVDITPEEQQRLILKAELAKAKPKLELTYHHGVVTLMIDPFAYLKRRESL
jgi:hypothetical protein